MRLFVTTFLLLAGLLHGLSFGAGYKVTKVVEVGPAAWVPFTGPLKWSPDGTKLAYFANNYLMISDTLGNSREVWKIDIGITPRRFEWASNDKVAINLPKRRASDSALYKTITVVDIHTGQETTVTEWQSVSRAVGNIYYEGPFLTLERNAYYLKKTHTGHRRQIPLGWTAETIDEPHWFFPDKSLSFEQNHFIHWHADGLYLVNLDHTDSISPVVSPHPGGAMTAAISPDTSYVFMGDRLIRVTDSAEINVNDFAGEPPDGTFGCGFMFLSFNPKTTEILFNQTCDGESPSGGEYVIDRIGTFNYSTDEFIILDTVIGIQNCTAPVYAPDGKKIAFLDNDDYKAYIICREEK